MPFQGLEEIVGQVERVLRFGLTIIAAYLVALWIASIWWTFRDIRARTTDVFLQLAATLLVAVFSFAGLVIYLILRPPKSLAQLYEESLEEEAFLQGFRVNSACPVCKLRTEPDFIFCPWCQTRLRRLCLRCEQPMMLRWKMCPYCGLTVSIRPPQPAGAAAIAAGEELEPLGPRVNGHAAANGPIPALEPDEVIPGPSAASTTELPRTEPEPRRVQPLRRFVRQSEATPPAAEADRDDHDDTAIAGQR